MPCTVLLPGLDGTGDLFAPFVAAAPSGFDLRVLPLPADRIRSYRELADWVLERLPSEPAALIAESFSGPLAVLVADQASSVTAVVLSTTFVKPPLPAAFGRIFGLAGGRVPPAVALAAFMTGGDRELARDIQRSLGRVRRDVVAGRIAEVFRVDVTTEFGRATQPFLCLRATRDRVVPSRTMDLMRASKPGARFVELQGPHLLVQTKSAEVWSHIAPFLRQVEGPECRAFSSE